MTKQYLSIEGAWDVVVCYGVHPEDLPEVVRMMKSIGAGPEHIADACANLSRWNRGVTFSSFYDLTSLVFIGRAETPLEFFNTIDHEIDHVQDHVARCYSVTLGTEKAAYLQGYIGGYLWDFVFRHFTDELRNW